MERNGGYLPEIRLSLANTGMLRHDMPAERQCEAHGLSDKGFLTKMLPESPRTFPSNFHFRRIAGVRKVKGTVEKQTPRTLEQFTDIISKW